MINLTKRLAAAIVLGLWLSGAPLTAQSGLEFTRQTRAERTGYRETSSYADVMAFVRAAAASSPTIHLTTFGYSMEGRALPLAVLGGVASPSAEAVRTAGKTRVFIQANIHAGEVCGKEALQLLLRDVANGAHRSWWDSLVVLVAPIYNADGNERVSLTNRGRQHGPVGGMGQRANAQGLDLNRDHVKVESPEARSLMRLLREYDPHVVVDLHTTNGTHHGYHLTYAPPLHPNTHPSIIRLLRTDWLPAVTRSMKSRSGWDMYYYGNVPRSRGSVERGWYTFDHRPRFNNNYAGLRNRFAILSEAYAYAPFEERVLASLRFVEELLTYAHRNASTIRRAVREADAASITGRELALTATWERSREPVDIIMGRAVEELNPYSGRPMFRRTDEQRIESMAEFGSFKPVHTDIAPSAYVVPGELATVLRKLDEHGVRRTALSRDTTMWVERFEIDSSSIAPREFQGHRVRALFGSYHALELTVPAGAAIVSLDQPLGRLVFTLLEPRSDDGLAHWNVLDDAIDGEGVYPILRVPAASARVKTRR